MCRMFTPRYHSPSSVLGPVLLGLTLVTPSMASVAQAQPPAEQREPAVKPVDATPTTPTAPAAPRGPVVKSPRIDAPGSVDAVHPNVPTSTAHDLGLTVNPPLIREGAFVSSSRGQLVRGKSGRAYFVFDRDTSGRTFPPMILLEGPNLAAMERLSEAGGPTTRLRIGGQVLVYRNHNYLLVTTPPLMERADAAPMPGDAAATEAANADIAPDQTPQPLGERSIDQIIDDLDKAIGPRSSVANRRPVQASQLPENASDASDTVVAESTAGSSVMDSRSLGFLTSRRGRLVRAPAGWLMFRPDNGSASKPEPGLTLLPCQNLMALENVSDTSGDSVTLTMSGQVHVYKGRHYLLPTMYVINRPGAIVLPTQ